MEGFGNWYRENKGLFIGMCVGLTVAILFLTIGFWATLLIAVCVGAGAFLGGHAEVREGIKSWFTSLFAKK
ncbi:MAG: DUF2273 domain-containing protein [Eubacteriales bacterium]